MKQSSGRQATEQPAHSHVSVVVLTYNEASNIEYCLKSVAGWASEIIVVDSFSTDRTLEICRAYTDRIYQHAFENHGRQVNWALDHVPLSGAWVLQLDADEMVTPELAAELSERLPSLPPEVTGVYIKRQVHFMGRWIKHGDYYPMWLLRLFRRGKARNEECEEDRVVLLEGRAVQADHDVIEFNRRGLSLWVDKHNLWAVNEMWDTLGESPYRSANTRTLRPALFGSQDQRRRWFKRYVYGRMPIFLRSFLYFFYRYIIRLGFLDGKEGLIFHFLQACWYRFLVDAKIYEAEKFGRSFADSRQHYTATKPWDEGPVPKIDVKRTA